MRRIKGKIKPLQPNYNVFGFTESAKENLNGPVTSYFLPKDEIDKLIGSKKPPFPPTPGGAA